MMILQEEFENKIEFFLEIAKNVIVNGLKKNTTILCNKLLYNTANLTSGMRKQNPEQTGD